MSAPVNLGWCECCGLDIPAVAERDDTLLCHKCLPFWENAMALLLGVKR